MRGLYLGRSGAKISARTIDDSSAAKRNSLQVAALSRLVHSTYGKYASALSSFEIAVTPAYRASGDEY
jgi:hypothetical protein